MKKWYASPGIQARGCQALRVAYYWDKVFYCRGKQAAFAVYAILKAMEDYPVEKSVQTHGCGTLLNLVFYKANADSVVRELNGVDLIIEAMENFAGDVKLQAYGSGALRILMEWKEYKKIIVEAGGRQVLLRTIENHADKSKDYVEEVHNNASYALKALL